MDQTISLQSNPLRSSINIGLLKNIDFTFGFINDPFKDLEKAIKNIALDEDLDPQQ